MNKIIKHISFFVLAFALQPSAGWTVLVLDEADKNEQEVEGLNDEEATARQATLHAAIAMQNAAERRSLLATAFSDDMTVQQVSAAITWICFPDEQEHDTFRLHLRKEGAIYCAFSTIYPKGSLDQAQEFLGAQFSEERTTALMEILQIIAAQNGQQARDFLHRRHQVRESSEQEDDAAPRPPLTARPTNGFPPVPPLPQKRHQQPATSSSVMLVQAEELRAGGQGAYEPVRKQSRRCRDCRKLFQCCCHASAEFVMDNVNYLLQALSSWGL